MAGHGLRFRRKNHTCEYVNTCHRLYPNVEFFHGIVVFSMSSGGGGAGPKRSLGGFQRAIAKLGKQAVAVKALMVGNADQCIPVLC